MSIALSKISCLITGLLALPFVTIHAWASDVTVESLREQNRQNLASVRTIVVEEQVDLQRTVPVDLLRSQQAQAIEGARDWSVKLAVAAGESEERIRQINDQADERYEGVEDTIVIEQVNATCTVRRTTTIDFTRRRVRRDDVDPRDLTRIGKEHRFGQGQLMTLDRTGSWISQDGRPEIQLHTPRVGKLATINSYSLLSLDREEAQLGALPERLFGPAYSVEVRTTDQKRFRLIGKDKESGRTMFEATVDAEKGNAMTELRNFNEGGELVEVFTASDFRRVDGVWLPFETRREVPSGPVAPIVFERHVLSTRINQKISDDLFAPPSDYRVVNLTGSGPVMQSDGAQAR